MKLHSWPLCTRLLGLAILTCLPAARVYAVEIKLARHPDYHEGKIVFSYRGDLWTAKDDGTQPQRLTAHRAPSLHPRFSPDGKWVAFSSARYGNNDVFIIPADGGEARRLTFHSADDTVVAWSRDSKKVIFTSARGLLYPGIPNLYVVPIDGGPEEPLPTDWGFWGSYSPDGRKFAFNRHPMSWSRKHYRGSYAADLWILDVEGRTSKKLLDADLPDAEKPNNFWPMYGNGSIYFVSDREVTAKAGSPRVMESKNNIWKISETGGSPIQVTRHTSGSLFWPSLSADGKTIVYEENFGLWMLDTASGETHEVKIDLKTDDKENNLETLVVNGEADSFDLSPSGKRAAISTHGELFTIATDRGDVHRLTQTPDVREVQPHWSPDGKHVAFISDKGGREELWLCDEHGQNLKKLTDSNTQKAQPVWSPDSQAILYTASDNGLHKFSIGAGKDNVLAHGDVVAFGGSAISGPEWSPDGKWVSFTKAGRDLLPHVYLIPADGGAEKRLTDAEAYSDSSAQWTPDGKSIVYLAGTDVANIGQAGRSTAQIYMVALTHQDKEPGEAEFDSEEEAAKAERARPSGRPRPEGGEGRPADGPAAAKLDVKIDFEGITRRARQLTRTGDTISAVMIAPDSKSVVFVTSGVEGGRPVQSIWSQALEGRQEPRRLTQTSRPSEEDGPPVRGRGGRGGLGSPRFAKDGRTLYYRQDQGIYALPIAGGASRGAAETATPEPLASPSRRGGAAPAEVSSGGGGARRLTFTARVEINHIAQRRQVFEESWRIMKHRFYAADMHGVDWAKAKETYEPLLLHVGDEEGLHDVVSMMIGELNASHTGISGGGRTGSTEIASEQTRYPGFEVEPHSSGYYKVTHIYKNGPADKDYVKIKVGDFIVAVDGQDLKTSENYWKLYAAAPGAKLEFMINSKPTKEGAWSTKIRPVSGSQHATLQYERWVADRRARVDKLSGGEIGYLHIRQMNEPSLRQFERDLAMQTGKKALVIDQRFNPGGGIDQELLQILQQRQYQYTKVRDSVPVSRPLRGFFGPMVVMENERSTSDAEVFPDGFKTLKLGKVVGVTTYGAVIGTGSYTLMDGSTIRTPGTGLWNVSNTNLENYGVPPDVYVDNTPEDFLKGRDAQIEKAVEVLKEELAKKK
ncbi:MAG: S41 family peptidase [Gemmataceae bacterium]